MSRPLGVGDIDLSLSSFAAINESLSLRLTLLGTGASLATVSVLVVPPFGGAEDITVRFTDISSSLPVTFISLFQAEYLFQQNGLYTFFVHESSGGGVRVADCTCAEWTSRIDQPISDFNKQRADLQRVFGRVSKQR